jgi:putative flippase GtrA
MSRDPGELSHTLKSLVRYAAAGGSVTVLYLCLTALLLKVGLPVQLGVALAYLVAVATHFVLQRTFVFGGRSEFALTLGAQARRFAAVALVQYGLTAGLVAILTSADVPDLLAVLITAAIVTPIIFVIARTRLFHGPPARDPDAINAR